MQSKRNENRLIPFGMLGVLCFLAYIIVSTDMTKAFGLEGAGVSALTSFAVAGKGWMVIFAVASFASLIVFSMGMQKRAYRAYSRHLLTAFVLFFNIQVLLIIGFVLLPLRGAFAVAGGTNTAHIIIIALVAVASNVFAYMVGFGYHQQPERKRLGVYCLFWAIVLTIINIISIILVSLQVQLFGLSERAMLFVLMCLVLTISYTETFSSTRYNRIRKED